MSYITEVVVVRSKTEHDAVVRLQSDAVLRGLRQVSEVKTRVVFTSQPESLKDISNDACILFHYDDIAASKAVRVLASANAKRSIGCFSSDIYDFYNYLEVHDIVDFYIAPTRLHRLVLSSQFYKPVFFLPEAVDSSAASSDQLTTFPNKNCTRLVWFGYPESFEKGMASLVPVLKLQEANGIIDSFSIITDAEKLENRHRFRTVPYRKASFAQDAARFDYCILSHFSLDLTLNSYIKSPNKLITSIALGLIPLASSTPAYEDILREFGLERFLFESPADLDRKLRNLNPLKDSQIMRDSGILETLASRYSYRNIAVEFSRILSEVRQGKDTLSLTLRPETWKPKSPELTTMQHLRDLLPSVIRGFRWRMARY